MRHLSWIICLFCLFTALAQGQTADEYLQRAIEKSNQKNYEEAIEDYTSSIEISDTNYIAFYNRGVIYSIQEKLDKAIADYTRCLKLNPNYESAWFNKAVAYAKIARFEDAKKDLDSLIAINPKHLSAFVLRGQVRGMLKDLKGACEDLTFAKESGEPSAAQFIDRVCVEKVAEKPEYLRLDWPDSEGWGVADQQMNNGMRTISLTRNKESLDSWTEFGSMMNMYGVRNVTMEKAVSMMGEQVNKNCIDGSITIVEKDENTEFPWVIFTVECGSHKDNPNPESQLWYITQGKNTLFMNFRAIPEAKIPAELRNKWSNFFKTAKIVNEQE